jgi:flavin-dependent dehydrogenase
VGPCSLNVALLARRPFFTTFSGDRDARLREFLGAHPALPPSWQAASRARGAGPFPIRARRPWRSNVVLVGDAAGFFDGITGEGMSLALVSARLCAEAVQQHLAGGDLRPFREYATKYRAAARNSEALGRLSLALAGRPRLARFAVRNLARRPATFDRLAAINAGELPFSAIRPRDIPAIALGL